MGFPWLPLDHQSRSYKLVQSLHFDGLNKVALSSTLSFLPLAVRPSCKFKLAGKKIPTDNHVPIRQCINRPSMPRSPPILLCLSFHLSSTLIIRVDHSLSFFCFMFFYFALVHGGIQKGSLISPVYGLFHTHSHINKRKAKVENNKGSSKGLLDCYLC